jgi:anti-sigma factor RsiW
MRCNQARTLFNAYLDGELSASQAAELGTHCVHCAECRRDLAMREVVGHLLAADQDRVALGDDFTERLLSCLQKRRGRFVSLFPQGLFIRRYRRPLFTGLGLAAAAVLGLMIVGELRRPTRVAGVRETGPVVRESADALQATSPRGVSPLGSEPPSVNPVTAFGQRIVAQQQSLDSLGQALDAFDLTVLQFLDIVDQQVRGLEGAGVAPFLAAPHLPSPVPPRTPARSDEVEDL